MALRDGTLFYFPIRPSEQTWIDLDSLLGSDIADACPFTVSGSTMDNPPHLQSLEISFRLAEGQTQSPQLLPTAPGRLFFHPAPSEAAAPTPANATRANFASFPKLGYWRLVITDSLHPARAVRSRLRELTVLPLTPTVVWLGPIELDEAFVFDTLPALPRADVAKGTRGKARGTDSDWTPHGIAGFLKGRYAVLVEPGDTESLDAIQSHEWPRIPAAPGGGGDYLAMITAAWQGAQPGDGSTSDYEGESTGEPPRPIPRHDPMHPMHGAIPARLLLRALRESDGGNGLIGAPAANTFADTVLGAEPRHHLVRFTRTWALEDTPDCSQHFPSQRVVFSNATGAVHATRLPCHGLVWVPLTAPQLLPGGFSFQLSQPSALPAREMRAIPAAPGSWRTNAMPGPYPFEFVPGGEPSPAHWQLRRRMGQEVVYDREARPTGNVCVYHSMRRTVLALVNNRIAGGRLGWEVYRKRREPRAYVDGMNSGTFALIRDAFVADGVAEAAALAAVNELQHAGTRLRDIDSSGATTDEGREANRLRTVLDAFFPGPATAAPGAGGSPPADWTRGRVFVAQWYTGVDTLATGNGRFAFGDDTVGRGAPGALVTFSLAEGFAVKPEDAPTGSEEQRRDALAKRMLATGTLEPGAVLQFWTTFAAFAAVSTRGMPAADAVGHSPTFKGYTGAVSDGRHAGAGVIDQNASGESSLVVSSAGALTRLDWGGYPCRVWIAANWIE